MQQKVQVNAKVDKKTQNSDEKESWQVKSHF